MLPGAHSFDDLRLKLIFFEQQSKFTKERGVPSHQVFSTTVGTVTLDLGGVVTTKPTNTNSNDKYNGGRNFGKRSQSIIIRFFRKYACRFCFLYVTQLVHRLILVTIRPLLLILYL